MRRRHTRTLRGALATRGVFGLLLVTGLVVAWSEIEILEPDR